MSTKHAFTSGKSDPADATLIRPSNWNADHVVTGAIEFVIDGAGSAITTGVKGDLDLPFGGTWTSWTILADQSGSIVIDLWRDVYANHPLSDADSITASAPPTLTTAAMATSSTLTGWTTAFSAGDVLRFNVDSATTVERVTLSLRYTES